ncbi:MAG: hypothetical protein H6672_13255 [Anaerolineaceae bacterium]|nr:hypothetical protein [Anaerolineaceae bacterium]
MAQRKRATATVKMTYSEDSDLIAWWNSIPRGSRNAVMKDMMRAYIEHNGGGYRPILPRNIPQPFDPGRFTQVCDDAAWIREALLDLPGYVERIIQQVAANGGVQSNSRSPTGQGVLQGADVSDEDAARRESRMKKTQW